MSVEFELAADEEALAVGFGEDCREARNNAVGWLDKESGITDNRFDFDKKKPFIFLRKKMNGGDVVRPEEPCINIQENRPTGGSNQITIRTISF